jgi:hypothetical protein
VMPRIPWDRYFQDLIESLRLGIYPEGPFIRGNSLAASFLAFFKYWYSKVPRFPCASGLLYPERFERFLDIIG